MCREAFQLRKQCELSSSKKRRRVCLSRFSSMVFGSWQPNLEGVCSMTLIEKTCWWPILKRQLLSFGGASKHICGFFRQLGPYVLHKIKRNSKRGHQNDFWSGHEEQPYQYSLTKPWHQKLLGEEHCLPLIEFPESRIYYSSTSAHVHITALYGLGTKRNASGVFP